MDERMLAVGLLGLFLIGLGIAGEGDMREAEVQSREYCEMVELHIRSEGENGWPDYKNSYEEGC
jgi:hypothetical protein